MSIYESLKNFYIQKFHERGEEIIPFLCNCSVPKEVFMSFYKTLSPIEEMPEKEKIEMKMYINELFPDKSVEEKLTACKIIYCLGNLI